MLLFSCTWLQSCHFEISLLESGTLTTVTVLEFFVLVDAVFVHLGGLCHLNYFCCTCTFVDHWGTLKPIMF